MRARVTYLLLLWAVAASALTIPQGTLYFDNSRTAYSNVQFVYGSEQPATTYVLPMTLDGNKWRVDIPQEVKNMYRFTFVGGELAQGTYEQSFSDFKEYVSKTLNLFRTATSEAQPAAGDIFVPESGDNWAQGAWKSLAEWQADQGGNNGTANVSGTLPVVYITTSAPVTSKETYVTGSLYIDPLSTGATPLGSESAPVAANFKGRGNWTWTGFDKKPYKIKFDSKQEVLGMPKNKHWCLLAHADDYLGYLRNWIGFAVSEAVGMKWTPRSVPVEVVMNGEYYGLYFLTEHVRVDSKRVNITEQDDQAVDSVSGGWLVEIDNYWEEGNVEFDEGNGQHIMVSMKSPEVLSTQQRNYIETQLFALNDALYGSSSQKLWSMLDLDEAAKYYLVQEILEDCESYHGSCYLYKDRDRNGQTAKWFFGPVWDFGNAYDRQGNTWIYENPIWPQYWIAQLATWPEFQAKAKEYWYVFYHSHMDDIRTQIADFASLVSVAARNDAARWRGTQNYRDNSNLTSRKNDFLSRYNWRVQWLYSQWGEGIQPATWGVDPTTNEALTGPTTEKLLRDGQLFILRNGQTYTVDGKLIKE
ncbi:MAG: CotH kinase family protein [Paludibacteraceae bacterium]|nr:CotH kinase family protein [Paludibacteraceae bacterium]